MWKDVTKQSLVADNEAPVNRNFSRTRYHWICQSVNQSGADADMGRPGSGHHWPKVAAGRGCEKQPSSDTGRAVT